MHIEHLCGRKRRSFQEIQKITPTLMWEERKDDQSLFKKKKTQRDNSMRAGARPFSKTLKTEEEKTDEGLAMWEKEEEKLLKTQNIYFM
jgi:hypothetical protein